MREEDIAEVVDEIVDDLGPDRIEAECDRLEISVDELMNRVKRELMSRLTGH